MTASRDPAVPRAALRAARAFWAFAALALAACTVPPTAPPAAAPEPVVELAAAPSDPSRLHGRRVHVTAPLRLVGHHDESREGRVLVSFDGFAWARGEGRTGRTPLVVEVDDGDGLVPARHPLRGAPAAPWRHGSLLHDVRGRWDASGARPRIVLEAAPVAGTQAERPPPPRRRGSVRVASFNLHNYFNGDGAGHGFPTARGARDPEAFARQRAKLLAAAAALDADLYALTEVENDGDEARSAQADFARGLEATLPGRPSMQIVRAPQVPGSDEIRVALIYRADRLREAGHAAVHVDGPFARGSRPPLAQAFVRAGGAPFVVAVNHFKSKRCEGAQGAELDGGDGHGCWNRARARAARALARWLATDPTGAGADATLVVGDLNAHTAEAPLLALRAAGYIDVLGRHDPDAYSYVHDGARGRLDHALATPALAARVKGAAVWHANADERGAFAYFGALADPASPWRASDHDPVVVDLD